MAFVGFSSLFKRLPFSFHSYISCSFAFFLFFAPFPSFSLVFLFSLSSCVCLSRLFLLYFLRFSFLMFFVFWSCFSCSTACGREIVEPGGFRSLTPWSRFSREHHYRDIEPSSPSLEAKSAPPGATPPSHPRASRVLGHQVHRQLHSTFWQWRSVENINCVESILFISRFK